MEPREKPANRELINFRIAPAKRVWLDELAYEHRTTRAAVVRAALAVAASRPTELTSALQRMAEQG